MTGAGDLFNAYQSGEKPIIRVLSVRITEMERGLELIERKPELYWNCGYPH